MRDNTHGEAVWLVAAGAVVVLENKANIILKGS